MLQVAYDSKVQVKAFILSIKEITPLELMTYLKLLLGKSLRLLIEKSILREELLLLLLSLKPIFYTRN